MVIQKRRTGLLLMLGWVVLCGCPSENFNNLLAPTMVDVSRIVSDTALTPSEKRANLEQLGISDSTINALMRDERLGNQFGGDLRTAYTKVTESRLIALTPDEVQSYGDGASGLSTTDELSVTLTDAEAQAIVTFFVDHDLLSKEALSTYLDDPANPVPSAIPDGVLRSLFVDFDSTQLLPELP